MDSDKPVIIPPPKPNNIAVKIVSGPYEGETLLIIDDRPKIPQHELVKVNTGNPLKPTAEIDRINVAYGLQKSGDMEFAVDQTVYKRDKSGALRRLTPKRNKHDRHTQKTKP